MSSILKKIDEAIVLSEESIEASPDADMLLCRTRLIQARGRLHRLGHVEETDENVVNSGESPEESPETESPEAESAEESPEAGSGESPEGELDPLTGTAI